MSLENVDSTLNKINWSHFDSLKLLFNQDLPNEVVDEGFDYFKKNFNREPNLVNNLLEFYFLNGPSSPCSDATQSNLFSSYQPRKSIIELIGLIPEDLSIKLLDKTLEYLKASTQSQMNSGTINFPFVQSNPIQQSQSSNNNSQNQHTILYFTSLERVSYLLMNLCYKNIVWVQKLISHQLISYLFKVLRLSNLNEIIVAHTNILLVALMTSSPMPLYSLLNDNLFQIFINNLKFLIHLEQKNTNSESLIYKNLRWSIRLCFYVCYGIYPNQFVQFLRKKDQQTLNKEYLNSIFFYMRFHPALLKEKSDSEKLTSKQLSIDDSSLEWRHFCLDPLYTTYGDYLASASFIKGCSPMHYLHLNEIQEWLSTPKTAISSDNSISLNEKSNKMMLKSAPDTSELLSKSIDSNSRLLQNNNSKPATTNTFHSLQKSHFIEPNKNAIVNLTEQFMRCDGFNNNNSMENKTVINEDLSNNRLENDYILISSLNLSNKRSLSDSNLFMNRQFKFKCINELNKNQSVKTTQNDPNLMIRSEIREGNLIRKEDSLIKSLYDDHSSDALGLSNIKVNSTNTNACKTSHFDSYDIVSGYFSIDTSSLNAPSNEHSDDLPAKNENNDAMVIRLKQEMDHLILQLQYERHLREKYEESSNRLYSFKIERDQLQIEKSKLELNLKQLVEKYKLEIEESLSMQNRAEIEAYRSELDEKNKTIENLLKKQQEHDSQMNILKENYNQMKSERDNLDKNYSSMIQLMEKEQMLNLKNQIDSSLIKASKNTIDLLRKKLLILSKSKQQLKQQQQMQFTYSQDLTEVPLLFNSLSINQNYNQSNESSNNSTNQEITPFVYKYQQNTIDLLKQQVDTLKQNYNDLLKAHNENLIELDNFKKKVNIQNVKIEELTQTILIDSKSETIKSYHRVYQSIWNVNKRLEMEIYKLRAEIEEKTMKINALNMSIDESNASKLITTNTTSE